MHKTQGTPLGQVHCRSLQKIGKSVRRRHHFLSPATGKGQPRARPELWKFSEFLTDWKLGTWKCEVFGFLSHLVGRRIFVDFGVPQQMRL